MTSATPRHARLAQRFPCNERLPGVLIRIMIETTQPLAGTAASEASHPLPFHGWLELLRVISELVDASPPATPGGWGRPRPAARKEEEE